MARVLKRAWPATPPGFESLRFRAVLINVPARLAKSARRLTLHLPAAWPWEHAWQRMVAAANGPPLPA